MAAAQHYRAYYRRRALALGADDRDRALLVAAPQPVTADRQLHYYWTYFMVPPAIASTAPDVFGDEPRRGSSSTRPAPACSSWVRCSCSPGARCRSALTGFSVSLVFLAASAEGAYILQRLWRTGGPLDALRNFNIDAVTRVVFDGLSIDDLR